MERNGVLAFIKRENLPRGETDLDPSIASDRGGWAGMGRKRGGEIVGRPGAATETLGEPPVLALGVTWATDSTPRLKSSEVERRWNL